MSNEEIALNKAIHGYLRSAMYRWQGKKEPDRNVSTVDRADKPGVTEFTTTLRADGGAAPVRLPPSPRWGMGTSWR